MISRVAVEYTSLRDIIPEHPRPPPILPPPNSRSWNEIPIKNPLVKQAALAYLQATPTPPDVARKGLFRKLRDLCFCPSSCRGDSSCFDFLNGVVFKAIAQFVVRFCELRGRNGSEEEDEEEEGEIVD